MNPLEALATMNPVLPVVSSLTVVVNPAWGPVSGSVIETWSTSPGFSLSVWALGVRLVMSASCGPGGPAGTPLVCRKAKFCGSSQLGFRSAKLNLDSRLSIVSAEHHCVLLQLALSANGVNPGG